MADALLDKLRALEAELAKTAADFDHSEARWWSAQTIAIAKVAHLLPAIIAQIESDAKDGTRYRWLRLGQRFRQGVDIGVGHRRIAKDLTHELMAFSYWCTPEQLDTAIDAAKERT